MKKISLRRKHYMYSYSKAVPKDISVHLHQYYEVLYFERGSAKYIIEDLKYEAKSGDIFITAPNELHSIVFTDDLEYSRHFVQVDTDFLNAFSPTLKERFDIAAKRHRIRAEEVKKHTLGMLFENINNYAAEKPVEFELIIQTYIIQIIAGLCSALGAEYIEPQPSSKKTELIKQYINRHFTENITLDMISENVFLNKYYMCHIFKEETGMTIKEYIELLRFMYARKLYHDGKKITDIATLCGYSDYSLFYKNFTRLSGGKSPTEYFRLNNEPYKSDDNS